MERQRPNNRGYITLLTTLIVTVFGVALAVSMLERGGIGAQTTATLEQSFHAKNYADACAEEALRVIHASDGYSGAGNLIFSQGNCTYAVTAATNQSTIRSTGNSDTAVRKVRVIATTAQIVGASGTTTQISATQWSEVTDF